MIINNENWQFSRSVNDIIWNKPLTVLFSYKYLFFVFYIEKCILQNVKIFIKRSAWQHNIFLEISLKWTKWESYNFQTLIITIVTSNFQFSTKKFLISPLKIPEPFLGQFINLLVATWFVSYDCHDCDIEWELWLLCWLMWWQEECLNSHQTCSVM